jgi:hypothetical protein
MQKSIKIVVKDFDLGAPLYLQMIAQAFTNEMLPEQLRLTDIYKRFLDNRVKSILSEKDEQHKQCELEVRLLNQAVASAFDEESEQGDELIRDLNLTCIVNGRIYFTNSSIAEYFIASALVKKLYQETGSEKIVLAKEKLSKKQTDEFQCDILLTTSSRTLNF